MPSATRQSLAMQPAGRRAACPLTRRFFRVARAGFLFMAASGMLIPAQADTLPASADLSAIHAKLQQLRQQNAAAQSNKHHAADALQQSEQAISTANRNLQELEQRRKESEQTLAHLHSQKDSLRTAVLRQQNDLSNLIRQQYFSGPSDDIKLLMSGGNPDEIARNLIYFAYINRARNQLIGSLQQNLNQLDQITQAEQQQQERIAQQREQREKERQVLQAERQQKKQVLKQLGTEIEAQRQQIATLEQNEKRITKLLQSLARAAAQKRAKAEARAAARGARHKNVRAPESGTEARPTQPVLPMNGLGRLKGHLLLPTRGELIHRFGTPREQGGTLWKGIFIKAPAGQAVHSVAAGEVVFADWLRGFGNLIIIDHGDGYMSLYSDNETLYKRVGDNVKAGDVIASVGNTGGNSETGLYFELRYRSQAFDPSSWIAR
ncbi:MAG TPA: peptidoglycan DD-metalloendopeptidase family protein [Burkholderiales bacterium]|nr:peptidoglycan DD-metalloendopeptidase family protein [Burkholderiales bacterium]